MMWLQIIQPNLKRVPIGAEPVRLSWASGIIASVPRNPIDNSDLEKIPQPSVCFSG